MSRQGTSPGVTRAEAADHGVQNLFDHKSVRWQQLILLGSWHAGGGAVIVLQVASCYFLQPFTEKRHRNSKESAQSLELFASGTRFGRSLQHKLRTISLSTSLRSKFKLDLKAKLQIR